MTITNDWEPQFSPWRHGGWYVDNLSYPSGAVGCVSRNFEDKKWRIVCDDRPGSFPGGPHDHTYPNRAAAARAEKQLADALKATWPRCTTGSEYCTGFLHKHENGDFYPTCWSCGIEAGRGKPGHPFADPPRPAQSEEMQS